VLQILAGLALGEARGLDVTVFSTSSWIAWLYLLSFGSIAGYTAYSWLLIHCPPAQVATYAYVNPVVAVALGATLGGEKMTPGMLTGAALIIAAVALVIARRGSGEPRPVAPATVPRVSAAPRA
jgi:drug/metabolite transporter (DMT)-like permease